MHWFLGFVIGFMPISFGLHAKFYCVVCQICTPRVHRIVIMRSIFFEESTFTNLFQIIGGNFLGFWQIFSSMVVRSALVSRFFQSDLCQFLSDITQNFICWSVRTALYVSTGLFSWEASSLRKTLFKYFFIF